MATTEQLTQVTNLYVALFNRVPDTAGLNFWANALASGASIETITEGFLTAPEGIETYSPFSNSEDFITDFYTTVFGRAPDEEGLAFWTAALNAAGGAESTAARVQIVQAIVDVVSTPLESQPEGMSDDDYQQTLDDRATFANKVEVGLYYGYSLNTAEADAAGFGTAVGELDIDETAQSVIDAKAGAIPPVGGDDVVTGTAGDDVFTVNDALFTGSIDGRGGNDTVVFEDTVALADATFKNIEVARLNGFGGEFDVTKITGLTAVEAQSGAVEVTGLTTQTLSLTGNAVVTADLGETATEAKVALNGSTTGGSVEFVGAKLTSATVSGQGTVSVVVTPADAPIVTLNVAATGAGIALGTIDTDIKTINASTSTAAVSASIGAGQAYTGGSGKDTVTLTAATTAAVTGGAGDADVLKVASGSYLGTTISGFEVLDVTGGAAGKYDATGFTSVQVTAATAAAIELTNVAAGTTLNAGAGFNFNVDLKDDAGTADSITLNLKAANGAADGTLTANDIETVNIVAGDTAKTDLTENFNVVLVSDAATSVVVSGTGAVELDTAGASKIASVDATALTGSLADVLDFGFVYESTNDTLGASVTIKGSTTLANDITGGNANDTIVGGAGDDRLAGGTGLDTLTGGEGKDTFVLSANANSQIYTTITDFGAGDTINFAALDGEGLNPTADFIHVTLASTATLNDYIAAAASQDVAGGSVATWFQFGGDTYLVIDNNTDAGFTADATTGDQLVKLTGTIDLTDATFTAGAATLSLPEAA